MNPWERRPKESYQAYEAFQKFLVERSYPKVAEAVGKSLSLIKRWAKNHNWRERADAWDNEVNRKAMAKAEDEFASMILRQLTVGKMFQVKGANAIQQMDLSNLPPKFLPSLATLVKTGVEIERSARELQIDKPQENLFVSTLEKISQRMEEEDD